MAMRTCNRCFENNWQFEHIDGYVRATCKNCGNEIRKHKSTGAYYYSAYFQCPACKTSYYSDKFKVWRTAPKNKVVTTPSEYIVEGLYCDAGTENNGKFGFQKTIVVVADHTGKVWLEEWIGDKTNNEGELTAIIKAASVASVGDLIHSDSQLAVNITTGRWKAKEERLKPLAQEAAAALKEKSLKLVWVPRDKNYAGIYIESTQHL